MRTIRSGFAAWGRDERGSIAIIFALSLMVLLGVTGLATDYAIGLNQRTQLQTAADFATVAATRLLAEGHSWDEAKSAGERVFRTHTTGMTGASIELSQRSKMGETAVAADVEAPWERYLSRIVYTEDSPVRVSSESMQPQRPVDIIFVIDVSYSMGIGASVADVDLLNANTGCAFACHFNGGVAAAHALGARLRIDVVRDAVVRAISEINSAKQPGDVVRVGLVTFSNSIIVNTEPTTDLAAAAAAANAIEMPVNDYQGGTDFHNTLATVQENIEDRDASRTDGTQTFVIFLTDGVEDTRTMPPGTEHILLRDADIPVTSPTVVNDSVSDWMTYSETLCDGIKSTKAQMMVVNVEYVTENVGFTEGIASTLLPIMPQRAGQCASEPGFVRSANRPDEIAASIKGLTLAAVRGKARIAR